MTASGALRPQLFATSLVAAALALAWLYAQDLPLRASIAFHHLASVRELAKAELPPRHNLVDSQTPQGHYGPYLVLLGAVARWTGAEPLTVLYAAGVTNLVAFLLAFRLVAVRFAGAAAGEWSALAALLLWGPWPAPVMRWSAWGWPGTTSLADAQNFFYPQHAGVVMLLLVLLLAAGRRSGESLDGTGEAEPVPAVAWRRRAVLATLVAAVLIASHPFTALALPPALVAYALAQVPRRRHAGRSLRLALVLPLAALALAALWPYYPVLGLLRAFTVPAFREPLPGLAGPSGTPIAATLPTQPPLPDLGILGPALVGLVGCAVLARGGRRFPLLWVLVTVLLSAFPLLPLRQRFFLFSALPLHLGAAALLAAAWARGRAARTAAALLLLAGAFSAAHRIRWVLGQELIDLGFVSRLTPAGAVVLSDPRTSNAVAGLTGRKIVAPEGPDLFLLMEGGGGRRVADVERFMAPGTSEQERDAILVRWRVTHVLVDRLSRGGPELTYPVVYQGGGYVLYEVRAGSATPAGPQAGPVTRSGESRSGRSGAGGGRPSRTGGGLGIEDLREVVAEMPHVVLGQVTEGYGSLPSDRAAAIERLCGHARDHVGQVRVQSRPQRDQVGPAPVLVGLQAHPRLLLVAGKLQRLGDLRPDETLVVVGRRIDEVSQDLLARPLPGSAALRRMGLPYGRQTRPRGFQDRDELAGDLLHRSSSAPLEPPAANTHVARANRTSSPSRSSRSPTASPLTRVRLVDPRSTTK